jgi:Transcriptional regulator, AbiEi antitoxin/Protein of unknown function (DUF559)
VRATSTVGRRTGIDGQIAQIASGQHGNVTRAQLLAAGLHREAISYRINTDRLFRLHRGVYSVGRPPTTSLEKASAAVLACGEHAALGFGSALTLWGFWKRWDEPFEVVVAGDRRPAAIRVHRRAGLLRRDVRVEQGVRVTSPAVALLDMAPVIPAKSLTRHINDGRRREILTVKDLADVVERFPTHPGAPHLRPHAATTHNPTRSGFEDDFLPFCRRYNLPPPQINLPLHGYEVDAYFEDAKLIVECDGRDFHNDRQAFEDDRERDATMLALGIATIRITWERLHQHPGREADRLHGILDRRRRRAA